MSDWLKAHPSWTERDYLYKLSYAKIRLIEADYTHSVPLDKKTKELWESYCKNKGKSAVLSGVLAAQEKLKQQNKKE